MKTGIIVLVIAIALMATIQTAMAEEPFIGRGYVQYENGTTFPHGALAEMWDLDHPEYHYGEPWSYPTEPFPPWDPFDWTLTGGYGDPNDLIKVRVTSLDGVYVGVNISRWADVQEGTSAGIRMDIIMYPVPQDTENFTKSLPAGWNLISLPLTPTDNSVSAVLLGVSQNAVKSYNVTTHQFENATTMDPGTGYFVHVTTAGTWSYEGTAYESMTTSLSHGLNMVGWTNTSADLPGALDSISGSYRYVAHWDATSQSYEVYEPNAPAVFNDFTTMERGEGYFIAATSGCMLTYP